MPLFFDRIFGFHRQPIFDELVVSSSCRCRFSLKFSSDFISDSLYDWSGNVMFYFKSGILLYSFFDNVSEFFDLFV